MKTFICLLPSIIMGGIMGYLGFHYGTWQFWAVMIPVSAMAALAKYY